MQSYAAIKGGVLYLENHKVIKKSESDDESVLITLDPSFEAQKLAINSNGSLLAVASHYHVQVWLLDQNTGFTRKISTQYDRQLIFDSHIVSLKWHPCARADAGLVVLTKSHLLSIFIPLGQKMSIERTQLRDSSNLAIDPVNFAFGASDSPLGHLTLYLGTTDGDIYKIFPYSPPEIELKIDMVKCIRHYVELDGWQSEIESWSDRLQSKVIIFKRKADLTSQSLGDNEPMRVSPYPSELYSESTLDLNTGSFGWNTDLIVHSCERYVCFYALTAPLSETLVTVATVKFKNPQRERRIDFINSHLVFISCDTATHVLDISPWSTKLEEALLNDSITLGDGTTEVTSHPRMLVYESQGEVVAVGTNERWPLRSNTSDISQALNDVSELQSHATSRPSSSFLDLELYSKNISIADEIIQSMHIAPLVSNWGANLGSLDKLNSVSREFNKKIVTLAKQLAQLQLERQGQRREALQQCIDITHAKSQLESSSYRASKLSDKIENVKKRQTELRDRLSKVTNKVSELEHKRPSHAPGQSEEAWFSELKFVLPGKLEGLISQIEQLKQSLSVMKTGGNNKDGNTTSEITTSGKTSVQVKRTQLLELNWRLKNQEKLITSLKSKLDLK